MKLPPSTQWSRPAAKVRLRGSYRGRRSRRRSRAVRSGIGPPWLVPAGPVPAGPVPAGPVPAGPVPAGPAPAGPAPAGRAIRSMTASATRIGAPEMMAAARPSSSRAVTCSGPAGVASSIRATVTSGPSSSTSTAVTRAPAARSSRSVSSSELGPERASSANRWLSWPSSQIGRSRRPASSASTMTWVGKRSGTGPCGMRRSMRATRTVVMCVLSGTRSGRCSVR